MIDDSFIDTVTLDAVALVLRGELSPVRERLAALEGLAQVQGPEGERGAQGERGDAGPAGQAGAGIEARKWTAGVYREGAVVTAYLGQFYEAARDTVAEPYGNPDDWHRLGCAGFHFAGSFVEGREYALGDLFVKDFGTFIQTEDGPRIFAGRGAKGEQGNRGDAGQDGEDGAPGRDGATVELIEARGVALAVMVRERGVARLIECDLAPMFEPLLDEFAARFKALEARIAALGG